jgi:hypothetical protein
MTSNRQTTRRAMIALAVARIGERIERNLTGGPSTAETVNALSLDELDLLRQQPDGATWVDRLLRNYPQLRASIRRAVKPMYAADAAALAERLPDGRHFRRTV